MRKVPIVATLLTFGISTAAFGARYFRGVVTLGREGEGGVIIFGDQKPTSTSMVYRTTEWVNESADVEEIEFFSDSGSRKAKLSAFRSLAKKCIL